MFVLQGKRRFSILKELVFQQESRRQSKINVEICRKIQLVNLTSLQRYGCLRGWYFPSTDTEDDIFSFNFVSFQVILTRRILVQCQPSFIYQRDVTRIRCLFLLRDGMIVRFVWVGDVRDFCRVSGQTSVNIEESFVCCWFWVTEETGGFHLVCRLPCSIWPGIWGCSAHNPRVICVAMYYV